MSRGSRNAASPARFSLSATALGISRGRSSFLRLKSRIILYLPFLFELYDLLTLQTGMAAAVSGLSFGVFFLILLLAYYAWENRRRDRVFGLPEHYTETEEMAQQLSNKTDLEIPSFRYVL